jgi:hypothetical protein
VRQLTLKADLEDVAQKYTGSFGQWMQAQLIAGATPTRSPASDTAASGQSPPPVKAPRSR